MQLPEISTFAGDSKYSLEDQALQLLASVTSKEQFERLTNPSQLPHLLAFLTSNLPRLKRYVDLKNHQRYLLRQQTTESLLDLN